jgi:hypothetical protein
VLAVAAAVAGGLVIALAAAGQRTATAHHRYRLASNAADAYVDPGFAFGDDTLDLRRVARLPQVRHAEFSALLAVIATNRRGRPVYPAGPNSVEFIVPTDGRPRDTIDAPKLLRGRVPIPGRPDEALADSGAAATLGLDVGDRLLVRLVSHDQLVHHTDEIWVDLDPRTAHVGPLATVRIVGVSASARPSVDGGQVHLAAAFYRAHGGRGLGAFVREMETTLKRGPADLKPFAAGVQAIAGKRPYGYFESSGSRVEVPRSISLLAQALRLLAVLGGVAGLLLIGQALARQAVVDSAGQDTLRALGMSRRQLLGLAAARAAVIAVPAAVLAAGIAYALSAATPFGWARELEPDPGLVFDAGIILPGAAAVLIVVLAMATAAGAWMLRRRPAAAPARAPGVLPAVLARARLSPPVWTGVRMALVGRGGGAPVPVRSTLAAAVLAVAVSATSLVFAASLHHLLHTPPQYGQTWDFEASGGGPPLAPSLVAELVRDPGVASIATGALGPIGVDGRTTGVIAEDDVSGTFRPTVLAGRPPRAAGEIALGSRFAARLHRRVGDSVAVHVGTRTARLRVVGLVVVPATKWGKLGDGAIMRFRALHRLQPGQEANAAWIRVRPGAGRAAVLARLQVRTDGPSSAVIPADVTSFGGVGGMPGLITAVFAVAAAAALAHALLTSVRTRRRDIAVLMTLGFTRPQVVRTVATQATTIALAGLLVGLPLGIGAGRLLWTVFADHLGVVPEAATPLAAMLLVVPAALLVANLVAAVPAMSAARTRPALVLHAE